MEKIVIDSFSETAQSLAQSMLACMPNLIEGTLGKGRATSAVMIATLLSGSRNGWEVVRVYSYARIGRTVLERLARLTHLETLWL